MKKTLRVAGLLIACAVILLSACTPKETEPTVNPDMIYTSAAMTVAAQLTEAAALNPTSTVTPMPSATLAPATPQPTIAGLSTSTLTILATFTATAPAVPVSSSTAKYELMTQSPDDQTKIAPNTFFHMVWTVKNTGTETWGKNYTIVFFTGNRLGGGDVTKTSYEFGEEVEPGDTIQLTVEMLTPAKEDTYLSWWKLRDDQGKNFGDVSVTIICTEEVASSG